ncbi:Cytochrome P450 6B2 [Eumeta japonica]|uniref:unspecific monooxygenase n=1 Tax=Eumeta variegata TaxID=151549 RepID=A0A4C1X9V4_EUMVA|nr:Cytochrome P450 6B2 [Eumeta japonica]
MVQEVTTTGPRKGWRMRNPIPFVGTALGQFIQKVSLAHAAEEVYRKYPNERYVGTFLGSQKSLVIRDPELIKSVLLTDFSYFHKRGLSLHQTVLEPLAKNLFGLDGDLWKLLRQRMTPAFSSGKLKAMFPMIVEKAVKVQDLANKAAKTGSTVDVRDLMARYTTDFIGACGFGIDMESLEDENSLFRKLGRRITVFTPRDALVVVLKTLFTEIFKNLHLFAPEIENSVFHLLETVLKQRNNKPSGRNDFVDLLLALKEKGKLVGDSIENFNPDETPKVAEAEMDMELMAAQVFVFFAAGFETSSSSSSYTLHQLAFHPEKQKKVQDEIDEVLLRYENKLCYDAIKEMKYLEMAFLESMRLFPSVGFLIRNCTKKYTLPGSNVTNDEGVSVTVPVQALHMDEKYFEEPENSCRRGSAPRGSRT